MLAPFASEPLLMPPIAADPPSPPVIACFPGLESNNFNGLVLICFCFARATFDEGVG